MPNSILLFFLILLFYSCNNSGYKSKFEIKNANFEEFYGDSVLSQGKKIQFNENNNLIVFIPEFVCNSCVDQVLNSIIKSNINKQRLINTYILVENKNARIAKVYEKKYDLKRESIHILMSPSIEFNGKSKQRPIILNINSKGLINKFYLPDKEKINELDEYLKYLENYK